MGNFYDDNEDLRFYIERALDWEPLVRLTEVEYRKEDGYKSAEEALDVFKDILDLVGKFAADEVAPVGVVADKVHPKIVDGEVVQPPEVVELFEQIKELELHRLCLPRELGGMNSPFLLFSVVTEIFARADVSLTAHFGFHGGMALAMLMYSVMEGTTSFDYDKAEITDTRFAEAIEAIVSGEEWGSMDITEPHAGSDMAALRTRGVLGEDGVWRVTGEKIFITSGHGRWHFVIARTEESTGEGPMGGLDAMSLFLVPAWSFDEDGNKVRHGHLGTLEDKLGHNGSVTVSIRFEDAPAELVGKRGEGFKQMLMIMNNARIGVGFESLGLCEAAYRASVDYAQQRRSMGKSIDRHEMIFDYLDEMKTDIQGIRALAMDAGFHEEMAQKLKLKIRFWPPEDEAELDALKKALKRHTWASRKITPLLKYIASEKAVDMARMAIQIHGGSGYIKEYPVEKLLRDAVVMPIYEGTSQIQSLMAMKDTLMGVVKNPRRFFRKAAQARWRSVGWDLEARVARLEVLRNGAIQHLMSRLAGAKVRELRNHAMGEWKDVLTGWDPKRDFALAMLHAERLTQLLTDVAIAEVLLEQANTYPERTELLERHLERAEPRCRGLHDRITTTGQGLLDRLRGVDADADEAATEQRAAK